MVVAKEGCGSLSMSIELAWALAEAASPLTLDSSRDTSTELVAARLRPPALGAHPPAASDSSLSSCARQPCVSTSTARMLPELRPDQRALCSSEDDWLESASHELHDTKAEADKAWICLIPCSMHAGEPAPRTRYAESTRANRC